MFLNMYRIRITGSTFRNTRSTLTISKLKKKRHLNNFITFVMVTIHPFSSNRNPWLIK